MAKIITPDCWVIVKITPKVEGGELHYRVFGGWFGGFGGNDAWKMNSGIEQVEDCGTHWRFHGHSGSFYDCHKGSEGLRTGYLRGVLLNLHDEASSYAELAQIDFNHFIKEFNDQDRN